MVTKIENPDEKKNISRAILESLVDWFGIEQAREEYISDSVEQIFFAEKQEDKAIGFLCLKETGKDTLELAVMGVLKKFHRAGIGRDLISSAKNYAKEKGYSFLQVKTVAMGYYEDYDRTNLFYQSIGFKELEVFPALWGEENPCQIYVMSI